jgi:hypothetical protein
MKYITDKMVINGTLNGAPVSLTILRDDDAMSPRKDSNAGHMICFSRRYNLGDLHPDIDQDELRKICKKKNVFSLPLYVYDHSGLSMATVPFHDVWDSGCAGRIYIMKAEAIAQLGASAVNWREKAKECLEAEVEMYDQYLRGENYGYILMDDSGELVDESWGFVGDTLENSGILEASGIEPENDER